MRWRSFLKELIAQRLRPNMRLKLPGAQVGRIAFARLRAPTGGYAALRPPPFRPQLKRDPLGYARAPKGANSNLPVSPYGGGGAGHAPSTRALPASSRVGSATGARCVTPPTCRLAGSNDLI